MLEQLAAAIEDLDVPADAHSLEAALHLRDCLDAKISLALRAFDTSQGWRADGSLSLTAWVAWHGRRSRKDAHREAVVARRLSALDLTAQAWEAGALSSGQVAAVVANVSASHAGLLATQEEELIPTLSELSVRETALAMRAWRLRAEAVDDGPEPPERPSELRLSETLDGRRELAGHFCAFDGALLQEALRAASRAPRTAERPVEEAWPRPLYGRRCIGAVPLRACFPSPEVRKVRYSLPKERHHPILL